MVVYTVNDNSRIEELSKRSLISNLANKDLSVLDKENFIIFPQQLSDSEDLNKGHFIFEQRNGETRTCNVVGIISDAQDEVRIHSRFSRSGKEDFFLRYMLQTVLNYNVVSSTSNSSEEISYYDLLVFLFPYYLNEAMRKGIYKEYVRRQYNDANIKGPIDIARHLKNNVPFVGKVAYRTREFSHDNSVIQLVRHTIEKLQSENLFLLSGDEGTKENIRGIKRVTNSYSRMERLDVIQENILNPVKHGYFEEYAALQRLCIQILREERTGFGDDDNKINGIIIDVAWLWEEYIWKVTGWKHYGRKSGLDTMPFFEVLGSDSQQHRYPDFVYGGIPIDTKYKRNIDKRNDYNQLTTYIHLMKATKGGFLQPTDHYSNSGYSKLGNLYGGGELFSYKFFIPQEYKNYDDFQSQMKLEESKLKSLNILST